MRVEHTRYEGATIDGDNLQLFNDGDKFSVSISCRSQEKFGSGSHARMNVTPEKIDAIIAYLQQVRETIALPETEDEG